MPLNDRCSRGIPGPPDRPHPLDAPLPEGRAAAGGRAGEYGFLGFFDLNGNGDKDHMPDSGDATTLGNSNKFEISAGQRLDYNATFDIVL